MISKLINRHTGIAICDGERWWGRLAYSPSNIKISDVFQGYKNTIPKELITWFKKKRVKSIRLIIPVDTHSFNLNLDEDAEFEESHDLVINQAEQSLGINGEDFRASFRRSSEEELNGKKDLVFSAYISKSEILHYTNQLTTASLKLNGISSLQLALINWFGRHAQTEENLLFFTDNHTFGVIQGQGSKVVSLRSTSIGYRNALEALACAETAERVASRLKHFADKKNLIIVSCKNQKTADQISPVVGSSDVRTLQLEGLIDDLSLAATKSVQDHIDTTVPFIATAPIPSDPRRTGSYICLFLITTATAIYGYNYHRYQQQISQINARTEAKKELEEARKSATTKLSSNQAALKRSRAIVNLGNNQVPLPPMYIPILEAIHSHLPTFTTIESVRQSKETTIVIEGYTVDQRRATKFETALKTTLNKQGIVLISPSTIYDTTIGKYKFTIPFGKRK